MKVTEKDSDRKAEINICIEGRVDPLPEYGEYVDPIDHASCCYVPLEEGQKPKISGSFSGTTLAIVGDAFVDGVHRGFYTYGAKAVRRQNSKRIMINKFLFKTKKGVVETQILVVALQAPTTQSDTQESIGTIELRLYCTREVDVSHEVNSTAHYCIGLEETSQTVTYKQITPTSQLVAEENSQTEIISAKKKRSTRPGKGPWAIFRFHYRNQEALEEHNLGLTFSLKNKKLNCTRTLPLEPVPPLAADIEPLRISSSSLPSTPATNDEPFSKAPPPIQTKTKTEAESTAASAAEVTSSNIEEVKVPQPKALDKFSKGSNTMESPYAISTENSDSTISTSTISESTTEIIPKDNLDSLLGNDASELLTADKELNLKVASTTTASLKRALPSINEDRAGSKRSKFLPTPIMTSSQPLVPQSASRPPDSPAISVESQLSNDFRKLDDIRNQRNEIHQKLIHLTKARVEMNQQIDDLKKAQDEINQQLDDLKRAHREAYEIEVAIVDNMTQC